MIATIKAVALDKDGVTFDSERLYADALLQTMTDFSLPPDPTIPDAFCGLSSGDTRAFLQQRLGAQIDMDVFFSAWFKNRDALIDTRGVPFMPGADRLIETLAEQDCPLALVTSDSLDNLLQDFARCSKPELLKSFSVIISLDDVSQPKPAPEPYLRAAAYLGVNPPQLLAIEDSDFGAQAALSAGCLTLMFPGERTPDAAVAGAVHRIITHHEETLRVIREYCA